MRRLKQYFFAGLIMVVPFAITMYVFIKVFHFVDSILGTYLAWYLKDTIGFYIPGLGLVIFVLLILAMGFLASRFFRQGIFMRLERWFAGLPLVQNIYPAVKQVILFVSAQEEFGFKKVVLVQYPSAGIWSIGFVTNDGFEPVNKAVAADMVAVFVPSSPNPLTGYTVFVPKQQVVFVDMSVDMALNIVISAGVFKTKK